MRRRDDWLDDDEYPDDRDIEDFGEDSPVDYHPLTMGYVGGKRPRFWTSGRILIALVIAIVLAALLLPMILPLLR
jgi:hypothetical protein